MTAGISKEKIPQEKKFNKLLQTFFNSL